MPAPSMAAILRPPRSMTASKILAIGCSGFLACSYIPLPGPSNKTWLVKCSSRVIVRMTISIYHLQRAVRYPIAMASHGRVAIVTGEAEDLVGLPRLNRSDTVFM
jgi:hypothetical protein